MDGQTNHLLAMRERIYKNLPITYHIPERHAGEKSDGTPNEVRSILQANKDGAGANGIERDDRGKVILSLIHQPGNVEIFPLKTCKFVHSQLSFSSTALH